MLKIVITKYTVPTDPNITSMTEPLEATIYSGIKI